MVGHMVKLTNAERAAKGEITIDPWPHIPEWETRYARTQVAMASLMEQADEAARDGYEHYSQGRFHTAARHFATAAARHRDLADQLSKASAALLDGPSRFGSA